MTVLRQGKQNEKSHSSILAILKQYELANIKNPDLRISRVDGGAINQNFKISDDDNTFLLKIFSHHATIPVDRSQVFKMQEELAILGLAPVPIFLNDQCTIYCEQWIEPPINDLHKLHVTNQQVTKVALLADVLYSVHTSFVSSKLLALNEHWQVYWQKIPTPSQALNQRYTYLQQYWHEYVKNNAGEFVLCHNDLHFDHISYPQGPIFDWEYAGLGCRYFDIANCCLINKLSQTDTHELCRHYAYLSDQDENTVVKKVQEMSVLSAFTTTLWSASVGIGDEVS